MYPTSLSHTIQFTSSYTHADRVCSVLHRRPVPHLRRLQRIHLAVETIFPGHATQSTHTTFADALVITCCTMWHPMFVTHYLLPLLKPTHAYIRFCMIKIREGIQDRSMPSPYVLIEFEFAARPERRHHAVLISFSECNPCQ